MNGMGKRIVFLGHLGATKDAPKPEPRLPATRLCISGEELALFLDGKLVEPSREGLADRRVEHVVVGHGVCSGGNHGEVVLVMLAAAGAAVGRADDESSGAMRCVVRVAPDDVMNDGDPRQEH